mgnify:FL=1
MEKRIISTQITEEDYGIENSLRPLSLDDYVGQNKVKSNLCLLYTSPSPRDA